MKFSYQWISELVSGLEMEPAELKRLITMKTAECEGIEPFAAYLSRVRVVRVLESTGFGKGKNKLVRIESSGAQTHQVVCGAPNVRAGMLVAWVPPGTTLGDKTIGTAVIEGVESEGMLASAAELDFSRDHSGLLELFDIEPGDAIPGVQPDWIIEIDNKSLTHRPDLWGHYGMAREVAAIAGRPLLDPVPVMADGGGDSPIQVQIADTTLCPRYSALMIENVTVRDSPLPLAARLQSIGMNPISNVVDVTNYVLAELPQPMHAFDADKLAGSTIYVRSAQRGETLAALNGETYELHPDDLVIADASGAIALAGVIGGASTAISSETKRIVLESANFQAASVRLTSSRHKLRTDASVRFEKSLDPENTVRGLARAHAIIQELSPAAKAVGGIVDCFTPSTVTAPIALPSGYVARKLGKDVSDKQVADILTALGFGVAESAGGWQTVTVPSWRATKDISVKADLVEEVGRMIGYDEITPQPPLIASVTPPGKPQRRYLRDIRRLMAAQGFTEIYSYSFLNEHEAAQFGFAAQDLLAVENPIAADLSHMRPSLLPGVFKSILSNVRNFSEFRLFEVGKEIHPRGEGSLPEEATHLVAALYSVHADEQDFFEMKRVLECLIPAARVHAVEAREYEHPTRTAGIRWHNVEVGRLFELHPALLEREGIEGRAILFDVDLRNTLDVQARYQRKYVPSRKYPTSGFDLSVVTDLKTPVSSIHDGLATLAGIDLAAIEFVRQYDGPPLPQGQKSVTYHLEVGSLHHTVTTEEVTATRNRIVEGMKALGFEFRE